MLTLNQKKVLVTRLRFLAEMLRTIRKFDDERGAQDLASLARMPISQWASIAQPSSDDRTIIVNVVTSIVVQIRVYQSSPDVQLSFNTALLNAYASSPSAVRIKEVVQNLIDSLSDDIVRIESEIIDAQQTASQNENPNS